MSIPESEGVIDRHPRHPGDAATDDQEGQAIPAVPRDPAVDQNFLEPPSALPPERMKSIPRTSVAHLDRFSVLEGQRQTGPIPRTPEHPESHGGPGQAENGAQLLDDHLSGHLQSIRETGWGPGRGTRAHQGELSGTLLPAEAPTAIDAHPSAAVPAGELPHQLPPGTTTGGMGSSDAPMEPGEGRRQELPWQLVQGVSGDRHPFPRLPRSKVIAEPCRHGAPRPRGGRGEFDETFRETGPALLESGSQEMPEPIPRQGEIPVGGIGDGSETRPSQRGDEGLPRNLQQGTDQAANLPLSLGPPVRGRPGSAEGPDGPHTHQPFPARAKAETQKHRFHLVVPMVRGRHPASVLPSGHLGEKSVPHPPRRRLETLAATTPFRHRTALDDERHPDLPGQTTGRVGAGGGPGIHAVVQVGRQEPEPRKPAPGAPAETGQDGEEGRGIRTAGEGDQEAVTFAHRSTAPKEPVEDVVEISRFVDGALARREVRLGLVAGKGFEPLT